MSREPPIRLQHRPDEQDERSVHRWFRHSCRCGGRRERPRNSRVPDSRVDTGTPLRGMDGPFAGHYTGEVEFVRLPSGEGLPARPATLLRPLRALRKCRPIALASIEAGAGGGVGDHLRRPHLRILTKSPRHGVTCDDLDTVIRIASGRIRIETARRATAPGRIVLTSPPAAGAPSPAGKVSASD